MFSKITKDIVNKDFYKLKAYAQKYYNRGEFIQSLSAIETASKLMYTFNTCYTDDEIESLIINISSTLFKNHELKNDECNEKKVILYDYFAIDNRGLTQQYLDALINLDYEILFITFDDQNPKKSEDIFSRLSSYKKASIYKINSKDYIEGSKELFNVIKEFGASVALLHTAPWDIIGILTWSYFKNIYRFMINITDHAFWLGKCCSDYVLEFRSYGYNISKNYRNIEENRLIYLPYYPIRNLNIPFEGFPFNPKGKKVIFSGGSLYKVYGSDIFFNTIKHIIKKYDDTIVLYAGNGNDGPFRNFIKENKFEERVYLIKERKDISSIFQNCYFYLGTFPLCGGLMTQYAVASHKVPVAYTESKIKCNFIESFLINVEGKTFTYTNLNEYYKFIDKLIENPDFKKQLENNLDDLIISTKKFSENLYSAINYKTTEYPVQKFEIDVEEFSRLYFDMENDYIHDYYSIFVRSRNIKLLQEFKKYFIRGSWNILIKKLNNLIKK